MDSVQGPSDNAPKRRTRKGIPNFPREIQAQKKRERDAARYQRKKLDKQQARNVAAHPTPEVNGPLQRYCPIAPRPSVEATASFSRGEPLVGQLYPQPGDQPEAVLRSVNPAVVEDCRRESHDGEHVRERGHDAARGFNGKASSPQLADRFECPLRSVGPTGEEGHNRESFDTEDLREQNHDQGFISPSVEIASNPRRIIKTGKMSARRTPNEDDVLCDNSVVPAITASSPRNITSRSSRSNEAGSHPTEQDRQIAGLQARVNQLESTNRSLLAAIETSREQRMKDTALGQDGVISAEKLPPITEEDLLNSSSVWMTSAFSTGAAAHNMKTLGA